MYVFGGSNTSDDKIDLIEKHNLQPGSPFEKVQIQNQNLLIGHDFMTMFIYTTNRFYIFGNGSKKMYKYELDTNTIVESELELQFEDSFYYCHSPILYEYNFVYLIGDKHCHAIKTTENKTEVFENMGVVS